METRLMMESEERARREAGSKEEKDCKTGGATREWENLNVSQRQTTPRYPVLFRNYPPWIPNYQNVITTRYNDCDPHTGTGVKKEREERGWSNE